jgi:hypothetical protein
MAVSWVLLVANDAAAAEKVTLKLNLPPGTNWTFDNSQTAESQNTARANGQSQEFSTKMTSRRAGKAEVAAAAQGEPTSLRITFDDTCDNNMTMGLQTQKTPFPYAGKTVTLTRNADGTVSDDFQGQADPQSAAELHAMLIQGNLIFPQQPVAIGEEWKADPKLLAQVTDLKGADDRAGMTLQLLDVSSEGDTRLAKIKVSAAIERSIGGINSTVILQGTALVDLASGHTIKSDLKGPMTSSGDQSGPGPGGQPVTYHVEGKGTVTSSSSAKLIGGGGNAGVVAPKTPAAAPANPLAAAPTLTGKFTDGKLTVDWSESNGSYSGTIALGDKKFDATAKADGSKIRGTFSADGNAFPFEGALDGDTLRFITGGTTYTLQRQKRAVNPLEGGGEPAKPKNPLAPGGKPDRGQDLNLLYQPRTLIDPTSTLEVATLLVPQGWKIDPGVLWRAKNAQFVTLQTSVFDPQRGWASRWLPVDQFACNPTMFANARQQGAEPLSTIGIEYTDTLPNAQQYIQTIVLPRYRKIPELKIVAAEDLPAMVQALDKANANTRAVYRQMGREMAYSAARMRVEYRGPANEMVEEDIYCVVNCSWDPQGIAAAKQVGLSGEYFFTPDQLYSYTAPKGQLDAAAPYLQTIIRSMRSTARWHAFVLNIQGAITHIALDRVAMEEAARKAITASQQKSVEESWKSADRQSREVGALLSNTQARSDPNNPNAPPIDGPAGKNSWTNPRGEWRHLPPNEDPNKEPGSSGDWKMAKNAAN